MRGSRQKKIIYGIFLILIIVFVIFSLFFISRPNLVYALQDFYKMALLYARVEKEIMIPTPYGRYYRDLYWKHFEELGQIIRSNPEYQNDMHNLMHLYIENVESVLDDRGSEVQITQYQVDELEAFFLKISAVASDELKEDINRELERTPLQNFVVLSMDETMKYIESTWKRDFQPTITPTHKE